MGKPLSDEERVEVNNLDRAIVLCLPAILALVILAIVYAEPCASGGQGDELRTAIRAIEADLKATKQRLIEVETEWDARYTLQVKSLDRRLTRLAGEFAVHERNCHAVKCGACGTISSWNEEKCPKCGVNLKAKAASGDDDWQKKHTAGPHNNWFGAGSEETLEKAAQNFVGGPG